ncbi:MAG: HAD hydrolase-like protein [Peptococcaceae bacterium]|nr:HAD hydrolase-like protein [Peptococcaceae bacterium]
MGAFLFDIGSTLVEGPNKSPVSALASMLGIPDSKKHLIADIILCKAFEDAEAMSLYLKEAISGGDHHPHDLITGLWRDQERAPREIPGATSTVEKVKNAGFKIGLVSDIWPPYYRGFVAACPELAAMVDHASLSFQEGVRKPSGLLFEKAVNALGVRPQDCWMVGDTYAKDLAPALAIGIRTIWVLNRPDKEYPEMEKVLKGKLPRPDIIVNTISDLLGKGDGSPFSLLRDI